jgi:hypothetical protein
MGASAYRESDTMFYSDAGWTTMAWSLTNHHLAISSSILLFLRIAGLSTKDRSIRDIAEFDRKALSELIKAAGEYVPKAA